MKAEEGEDGTGKISIVRFLFKKELIIFFACAMIPYLFCGYFLNYFLPLFAESQGMAETAIGQLFLINGICVIYLGAVSDINADRQAETEIHGNSCRSNLHRHAFSSFSCLPETEW